MTKGVLLALLIVFSTIGCSSVDIQEYDPVVAAGPKQKVYNTEYENVWRAVQLALSNYPVRVNDMEAGVLETDYIRGANAWKSPHNPARLPGGLRYKISVRVLKGKTDKNPAVQVTVLKRIEHQKDFFSKYARKKTDGLEEIAILYRIDRELLIQKALEKAEI